jgi:hypothetical protein
MTGSLACELFRHTGASIAYRYFLMAIEVLAVGWKITDADETALAELPEHAWTDSLQQDGTATD